MNFFVPLQTEYWNGRIPQSRTGESTPPRQDSSETSDSEEEDEGFNPLFEFVGSPSSQTNDPPLEIHASGRLRDDSPERVHRRVPLEPEVVVISQGDISPSLSLIHI